MEYETNIEVSCSGNILTKVINDEELELKISSSSNNPDWIILEDIYNDSNDEDFVAIPKTKEGIDKTIKLLEKARDKFLK